MTSTSEIMESLVSELELDVSDDGTHYSAHQGYPFALWFFNQDGEHGLMFQIRHPLTGDSLPDIDEFSWSEPLDDMIAHEQAKIDIEDGLAWFTLFGVDQMDDTDWIAPLFHMALDDLHDAGLTNNGQRCHYCHINDVPMVSYFEGRVAQICEVCLSDRLSVRAIQKHASVSGVSVSLLLGAIASCVGAVIWVVSWAVYDIAISLLSGERGAIAIPYVVMFAVAAIIGAMTGGPVAYIIHRIPDRGDLIAGMIGAACSSIAVLCGEAIYIALYVFLISDGASDGATQGHLWTYWEAIDIWDILEKLVAAIVAIVLAFIYVRPKRVSLEL